LWLSPDFHALLQ
jgi:hypothetical protein